MSLSYVSRLLNLGEAIPLQLGRWVSFGETNKKKPPVKGVRVGGVWVSLLILHTTVKYLIEVCNYEEILAEG
jgi:hypothetical protein